MSALISILLKKVGFRKLNNEISNKKYETDF